MRSPDPFLNEHARLTRRFFVGLGAAGAAAWSARPGVATAAESPPELEAAIAGMEPLLTPPDKFRDVSRGKPIPHTLSDEQRVAAGLTRETWKLDVIADPDQPAKIKRPLTQAE